MKTTTTIILVIGFLSLAPITQAWEFNTDRDREGWTRSHSMFEVKDGKLIVTPSPNNNQNVRAVCPPGAWDLEEVTGVYMKVTSTKNATELGGKGFHYWTESPDGKQQGLDLEMVGKADVPEIVFVDFSQGVEGQELRCFAFNFPRIWNKQDDGEVNDISYEVDWVRLEGQYLVNESFEQWDFEKDQIAAWTADVGFDFPDPMPPDQVNGRYYAAIANGNGSAQSLTQSIKGGGAMTKGTQVMLAASFKVPTGALDAGSEISLTILEDGVNTATVIPVNIFDAYFEATAVYTLQKEAASRQSLDVKVTIKSPNGSTIYVDDIFVAVLPESNPMPEDKQYGWPVHCVKLAEGQEITIDGIVTPEEYAGAKAVLYNAQTWNAQDPYDPNYIHEALSMNSPDAWPYTSLEDFNETYYLMWDDEALYIAAIVQDDIYTPPSGNANTGDMIQIYLTATTERPFAERRHGYIPTLAPEGKTPGSDPVVNGRFGIAFAYDILEGEGATSTWAGKVDHDTQDWSIEVRIPWNMMITDFLQDLPNSLNPDAQDIDGNGRNVFPPEIGDIVGLTLMAGDTDAGSSGFQSWTHSGKPWEVMGTNREERVYSNEPLIFEGPAQ